MSAQKTQDWHSIRAKGIGGSEITAVLGLDPYMTPYQLWERKTGRVEQSPSNAATERGHYLEPSIAAFFADKTGFSVWEEKGRIQHTDFPFLLGETDRIFRNNRRQLGVLECKSTRLHIDPQDIPIRWFFQAQYYMGILGHKVGGIAWISAGLEMDYRLFEFDAEVWETMVEQAREFWRNYVIADIAPPPLRKEDIMKIVGIIEPKAIEVDEDGFAIWQALKQNRAAIKELEEANEGHVEALQLRMMQHDTLTYQGRKIATWKKQETTALDQQAFREGMPDAFKMFLKTSESRVFRVK